MRKKYIGQKIRVVTAEVRRDDQYLITQRLEKSTLPGLWEFPGGKIAEGEIEEDALKRELFEELGVNIHVNLALQPVLWKYPDKQVELYPMICERISGTPRPLEHQELRWCSRKELKSLNILDADIAILNQIERLL